MKRGSYTVEAALLMGVLLPLFVSVFFLGVFRKTEGELQAKAVEEAVLLAMEGQGEEDVQISLEKGLPGVPFGGIFFKRNRKAKGEWQIIRDKPRKLVFRMHSLKKLIRQVSE